jgi:hypothetical protein
VVTKTRELMSALAVAFGVAATGLLLGFVWILVAPTLPLRKVEKGMAYIAPDPEQPVAGDGWFTILGLVLGLIVAIMVWIVAAKARGPIQLIGLTLGALAAGYLAWQFTVHVPSDYAKRVSQAQLNDIVQRPPELNATNSPVCLPTLDRCRSVRSGELWVPALGAVVGYSLMAGWSRWPNLRREEGEPQPEGQPQFVEGAGPS